jgi:hypothetical protein
MKYYFIICSVASFSCIILRFFRKNSGKSMFPCGNEIRAPLGAKQRKEFSMKNAIKLIGIALVAIIIGFSFTACEDGDKGGSNVPSAPTGLTAYASSSSEIILSWNSVSGAAGYKVYASASYDGSYTLVGQITTNVGRNYNMTPNTTRYYRVTALNSYGESGYSNIAYATTLSDSGGGHTHTYSSTWSSNAAQHWLECTAGDGARIAVASHTFNGSICLVCNYNNSGASTLSLDGVWRSNAGNIITISGSTGVFTHISDYNNNAVYQDAVRKGYLKVGDLKYKNLRNTGGLTWTGDGLQVSSTYNTTNATGVGWFGVTITLSADGQTYRSSASGGNTSTATYTRQ